MERKKRKLTKIIYKKSRLGRLLSFLFSSKTKKGDKLKELHFNLEEIYNNSSKKENLKEKNQSIIKTFEEKLKKKPFNKKFNKKLQNCSNILKKLYVSNSSNHKDRERYRQWDKKINSFKEQSF